MAVDTIRYRSRRNRESERAAIKAKREKILLGVCGVVLVALLAVEGPKTLNKLHGSSASSTPSQPATAVSPAGAAGSSSPQTAAKVSALKRFGTKDPFIQQVGGSAAPAVVPSAVTPPAVRSSHFVAKDPFVQQVSLTPTVGADTAPSTGAAASSSGAHTTPAGRGDQPQPTSAKNNGGNYIVVLASVAVSQGRADAVREAAAARTRGVANVRIVDTSRYPTLRTGYYAVYSGPYPTFDALKPALEKIRGQGYPGSYTRRLAR